MGGTGSASTMPSTAARSPISSPIRASTARSSATPGSGPRKTSAASTPSPPCPSPRRTNCVRLAPPADPVGTHLIPPLGEIARIFSTSGTTGTPSYVPLTSRRHRRLGARLEPLLLRLRRSARHIAWSRPTAPAHSSPASPSTPSTASASPTSPSAAAAPTASFPRSSLLKADTIALTPSYALHIAEWAAARGIDLAASSVERLLVAGEPGGGEPALRARLEDGVGCRRHRGDGHRRHLRFALGRVPREAGHALQRPRLRPFRADRRRRPASRSR